MCGIAGILPLDDRPVSRDAIRRMTGAIVHRGPDDEGHYIGPGIGIAMRRLSIIDLAGGKQPIANEDGSIHVVLNGEIYNFQELRIDLEKRGHRFATQSDTEVIVHLYEEMGADAVTRLRGMFAFAVWDGPRRRLLLARDRLGIKPLYYSRTPHELLFASELKSILAVRDASAAIDGAALRHLLSFGTTSSRESIVEGVAKLPPGHVLLASRDAGVELRRYWRVAFEPDHGPSEAEWEEAIRAAIEESVRLHMVSDVPLGAFLSGGVDSSAIVAAMARAAPGRVRTFSIGFAEEAYDERPYARLAASAFGTDHHEDVLRADALPALQDLAWYLDEPFGDSSAIPTYMVSALAASGVTVVLSGDGGDELFAGYDRYRVEERQRRYRFLPRPLRALLASAGDALPEGMTGREMLRHLRYDGTARYLDAATIFHEAECRRLLHPDAWALVAPHDPAAAALASLDDPQIHWLSALQRVDLEGYLPLDILTKVDRMSMAHSIEARVPLLDHPLVELAARIPPDLQLRRGRGKHLFKRALRPWLPRPILERPKRGFAVPLASWFRQPLAPLLREVLLSDRSRKRGILNPRSVEDLLRLHDAGRPLDLALYTLLSLELWCRQFLDGRPTPASIGAAPMASAAPVLPPQRARQGARRKELAFHEEDAGAQGAAARADASD